MIFELSGRIETDQLGLNKLAELSSKTKTLFFDNLSLDCTHLSWIDANLCAAIGCVLSSVARFNNIEIIGLNGNVGSILEKNGFWANFGGKQKPDYHDTIVEYKKFAHNEIHLFRQYLDRIFQLGALKHINTLHKNNVIRNLIELFLNASEHSGGREIFGCGQYYPKIKKISFTLSNDGRTINDNVCQHLGSNVCHDYSIDWAIETGNTTRVGDRPGGLGLSLIKSLLDTNKGAFIVLSGAGYWSRQGGNVKMCNFEHSFCGTLVNITINVDEESIYGLS